MVDEFCRSLWNSMLLEVPAGADAYERRAGHASDDRVLFVDGANPDSQIDPVIDHVSYGIRKNHIYLKAGIERQQVG